MDGAESGLATSYSIPGRGDILLFENNVTRRADTRTEAHNGV